MSLHGLLLVRHGLDMLQVPKATKPPKIETVSVRNWLNGTVTNRDDARTPLEGLRSSGNVVLDQDGTVRPRPSLTEYGPQPTGTVLGEIYEFRKFTGLSAENWLICMQNISGTTSVYIARGEDSSWTQCTGKTYDNTATATFLQIDDKVLIMNGTDTLSFLTIGGTTITAFTALTTPSAPTLSANTGLSGTDFNTYYAITANSTVGETDGSSVLTVDVSTDRDLWDPETQSIKIAWSAVTDAETYNVYMGTAADGAGTPTMYLIAGGLDSATLSFTDNGTRAQDLSRPLPTANSTAGPKVSRGNVINGRVWLVGDSDNRDYVWRGGDFGFELDFSPSNGGGFSPIGQGSKNIPVQVLPYRSGQGEPRVTVLTQETNGKGKRYILTPQTLTYGTSSFVVWQVNEDSGQDGTDSPNGVVLYDNSIWYPSRDGFKTTGTKPQLQNVLSTDRISNTIQPDISTLNTAAMEMCVGMAHEGKIYWAVPVNSSTNNEIWVLDLDRKGAWMKPWNVAADWMTLYNDNDGVTHHLVLKNNKIYELSYRALTADDGVGFSTSGNSGQIRFSEDGREWARVIRIVFTVLRTQGGLNFTVSGKTEDTPLAVVGSQSFTPQSSRAGWSEPGSGWSRSSRGYLRGWSEINVVPVSYNSATQEVAIEVDEDLQWFSYGWTSTGPGVSYNLSDVVAEYVPIGIKEI